MPNSYHSYFSYKRDLPMIMKKPTHPIHWLQIYKLYRQAFPRYERKPFAIIRSMYKKGNSDIWYFSKDGRFAGLVFTVNRNEAVLIDYLAVCPHVRGDGIGSKIIAEMKNFYSPKGIFVEIESVYATCDNITERLRRKEFYLKNGMTPMNVMVVLFGVEMELLGFGCKLNFNDYFSFYHDVYGPLADKHVWEAKWPEDN